MQTRFRPVFVALGSLLFAHVSLAQTPAPKPARPEAAPKPARPEAATKPARPEAAAPAPADAPAPAAADDAEPKASEPPASEPAPVAPADAAPAPSAARPKLNALPAFPEPSADAGALQGMGRERPAPARKTDDTDVFAEDWWSHARPILELHGNFRVRAEMFYRFSLGRIDDPAKALWPRPPDSPYTNVTTSETYSGKLCTPDESGSGSSTDISALTNCKNNTQAGANLRFRLNPEIHISDNLRVISQIDLLDNVVLGSTPSGYSVTPSSSSSGYNPAMRTGYDALGFNDQTTSPPRSGVNSLRDSIHVKRAWGEYSTPIGEARFGRMPNHWGLGMVNNAGDGYDDDYQSTIDRLQFVAGIKPLELYIAGSWDFPNEGATSDTINSPAAQPYDLAQLDDVDQYVLSVVRKKSPELTRLALTRGELVINAGLQLTYRKQLLDGGTTACLSGTSSLGCNKTSTETSSYVRRDAHYYLPDVWVQILYKQFRFEAEAATVQGSIGNITDQAPTANGKYTLASWGFVAELEQRLVENKLRLGLGTGWASGDADVDGLAPSGTPTDQSQHGDHTISTFRFNPAYRVDLILNRNILSRIQGTYYFRPNLSYDFLRDPTGQRLGGSVAGIWTRASEFIQAPGHARDLGIELNGALYFQSKDGALNDDPNRMGGFYARLEYGILFPMAGLGYPSVQANDLNTKFNSSTAADVSSAQILRLYLGATF